MSDNYETEETSDLLRQWCEAVGEVESGSTRWRFWRPDGGGAVQCEDFDGWYGFGVIVDEMRRRGYAVEMQAGSLDFPDSVGVSFHNESVGGTGDDLDPARAAVVAALRALDAAQEAGA